mgnify:CR=1 FL=1
MSRPLIVNGNLVLPASELSVSYVRSSGPGGQNVNKVSSKAVLRWNVAASTALTTEVRMRFLSRFASRITQSGDVVITSDKYRDQPRNLNECYEKLRQLLLVAYVAPRRRAKSQPTRGSIERRLADKRKESQQKQQRRFRSGEES